MPLIFADRVKETTATTGTGTVTLGGALAGYQTFSSAVGNGNTCYYALQIVDSNGNPTGAWEVGSGTYTSSGNTLSRTLIASSTGSLISLTGSTQIWLDQPAAAIVVGQPAFQAYMSSNQSLTSATATKLTYNTKVFDTNNYYDSTTNYRFTPLRAGKYMVRNVIAVQNATTTSSVQLQALIYKNGAAYYGKLDYPANILSGQAEAQLIVQMNGSTDYLEGWVYASGGGAPTAMSGAPGTTLFACLFEAYYIGP